MQPSPFAVKINGIDALVWRPPAPQGKARGRRPPVISYTLAFEERQAAAAAGLTWDEYQRLPGSPQWATIYESPDCKCSVVMWYRYRAALENLKGGF